MSFHCSIERTDRSRAQQFVTGKIRDAQFRWHQTRLEQNENEGENGWHFTIEQLRFNVYIQMYLTTIEVSCTCSVTIYFFNFA